MKKVCLILILFYTTTLLTFAEGWDAFDNVDRMWDGQRSITNQQFEEVMNQLEEKSKQKEEKAQKKKRKKLFGSGSTLHDNLNPDNQVNEIKALESKEDLLINIPVQLIIGNKTIERGFYKVIGEKDSESQKLYLNLYQSQYFKGKIEVIETDDDFGEEKLDFAKVLPYNESFIKIIFGSIDFNAYAYVPFL